MVRSRGARAMVLLVSGKKKTLNTLPSGDECAHALRESDKLWALDFSIATLSNTCELAQKSINQHFMRKETNARLHDGTRLARPRLLAFHTADPVN
jgi:hypothetical protein